MQSGLKECLGSGRRLYRGGTASTAGQAAVETAIVAPAMVFLLLGILQLTLAQQARLQLDYAAFVAARSGSVWNMDRKRMTRAALTALLPTLSRVDDPGRLERALSGLESAQRAFVPMGLPARLKISVLRPTLADFAGKEELDFDAPENLDPARMTLRVVYAYELSIPFVNALIWDAWYAVRLGRDLPAWRIGPPALAGAGSPPGALPCAPDGLGSDGLAALARVARRGRYLLPLVATYTIRMQSNPFARDPQDPASIWAGAGDGC
jgi:hypothetical protein